MTKVYGVILGLVLTLLASLWSALPAQAASSLTEAEVKAFMTQLETETRNRNYAKVVGMMSPEISIRYLLNNDKHVTLTRDQYLQNAMMSGMTYKNYQYRTRIQSIKVDKNVATVNYTMYEQATSPEQGTIYCMMNNASVLEKRNGRLLMRYLSGNGMMSKEKLF